MSTIKLAWRKSSYSGSDGDSCVEVAGGWRKSSHSGSEGSDCVEVGSCVESVHIRDSKVQRSPELGFTPAQWSTFLTATT